jgi:hypothetical protein
MKISEELVGLVQIWTDRFNLTGIGLIREKKPLIS